MNSNATKKKNTPNHGLRRGKKTWQRLKKNSAAMISIYCFGSIVLATIILPWVLPHGLDEVSWEYILVPPTLENSHWLGTDPNGRDLFVRILFGLRISLLVGVFGTMVTVLVGVFYGMIAGYLGSYPDALMMRFVDILYSIPFIFIVIIFMIVFGWHFIFLFLAIGLVEWLTMSRIIRGRTLSIAQSDYVEAARVIGTPKYKILLKHILPNLMGTVIIYTTLQVPEIILIESSLSFLGLGVQEPLTSLGVLIAEGAYYMEGSPWLLIFPSLFLNAILLCLAFIGNGLRDAIDPKD